MTGPGHIETSLTKLGGAQMNSHRFPTQLPVAHVRVGTASWENAMKDYRELLDIDERIGDMRHYDEIKNLFSIVLYHQGDTQYGLETADEVLERATQRKDIMPQICRTHYVRRCSCANRSRVRSRKSLINTKYPSKC